MPRKRVIVVTDGDRVALEAVEKATENIQGRCISLSGGHAPGDAYLSPGDIVQLILSTPHDPVVVMVDDEGDAAVGHGEQVLKELANNRAIDIIGAVAVASHTKGAQGVYVDASIARNGNVVEGAVNKEGRPVRGKQRGDTVGVLAHMDIPCIVGLGDPGKMDMADDARKGAPITTKALQTILKRQKENAIQ